MSLQARLDAIVLTRYTSRLCPTLPRLVESSRSEVGEAPCQLRRHPVCHLLVLSAQVGDRIPIDQDATRQFKTQVHLPVYSSRLLLIYRND